jgi:DNA-binding LacI/PurR family transcriptional regulator
MAKVTIEDISQLTGLSRGTVSRALNNRPDISQATRQRVLEACTSLNYVPSLAARALATGRSYVISVLAYELASQWFSQFLRGVIRGADALSYAVHVIEWPRDPATQAARAARLESERMDAVLVTAPLADAVQSAFDKSLAGRRLGTILPSFPSATDVYQPDLVEGARLIARRLTNSPGGAATYLTASGTGGAFGDALSAAFREIGQPAPKPAQSVSPSSGAIIAEDEAALVTGLRALAAQSREPGRDAGILVCGGGPLSESLGITSLDWEWESLGKRLAHAVLGRIGSDRNEPQQHIRVAPTLVERRSLAPAS